MPSRRWRAGWRPAGSWAWGPGCSSRILFLWQLPHTLAIARLYREDYARAGIRVLPVVDPDGGSTERQIVTGLSRPARGRSPADPRRAHGGRLLLRSPLLGAVFLAFGTAQALRPSALAARRVVIASVIYLPLLLVLMALDKVG